MSNGLHYYKLGIEFTKCDDKDKKYCLHRLRNKDNCSKAIYHCHYPMSANPLCFCDDYDNCPGYYEIITKDDKIYILYKCDRGCGYFFKGQDFSKIINLIKSPHIFIGKDLDELVKKLKPVKKGDDNLLETINFFADIFLKNKIE